MNYVIMRYFPIGRCFRCLSLSVPPVRACGKAGFSAGEQEVSRRMNRRPTESRKEYDSFSPRRAVFAAASPDDHFFEARKKKSPARRLLRLTAFVVAVALAGNLIANRLVSVLRVEVPVRGLGEAFDGFTILHISDLKGASFGEDQLTLRLALQDAPFDAVAMTGDMISALGNPEPFYALLEMLRELNPAAPLYFIAGDDDPEPLSMAYATWGSPFAPWVLGARQRGATLLSWPQCIERDGQRLWMTTSAQLNLDLDYMQKQYELQYISAWQGGDENAIELAEYNLQSLAYTREARADMQARDAIITLTHVPPAPQEALPSSGIAEQIDLVLGGHYMGGLVRLPLLGAVFIPSLSLPRYGIFPGEDTFFGLSYAGRTAICVSPGLGAGDSHYPPFFFRLFNPPSVTLITLVPSAL